MRKVESRAIIQALSGYTKFTRGKIGVGVLKEIGDEFGLSRERVRQIAKKEGFIMPRDARKMLTRKCGFCGKKFHPTMGKGKTQRLCSGKCRRDEREKKYFTTFTCTVCGIEKRILKSDLKKRTGLFCSRTCYGVYRGKSNKGKKKSIERTVGYLRATSRFKEGWFTIREYGNAFGLEYASALSNLRVLREKNILQEKKLPHTHGTKAYKVK